MVLPASFGVGAKDVVSETGQQQTNALALGGVRTCEGFDEDLHDWKARLPARHRVIVFILAIMRVRVSLSEKKMSAQLDAPDEYTRADAEREDNLRIFRALSGLRRAGVTPTPTPNARRVWGTLCTEYTDTQEARLHATLRPFLHATAASDADLLASVAKALVRVGIVATQPGGDVFEVVGAVDGVRQVQVFPQGGCLEEYLLS